MIRVSFDFDGTLYSTRGTPISDVVDFCGSLSKRNDVEVWIVTARPSDPARYTENVYGFYPTHKMWSNNDDLFPLAQELLIPRERIVFTEREFKCEWFKLHGNNFAFHLDDDPSELRMLQHYTNVIGISVKSSNWKRKCIKRLESFNIA